MPQQAPFLFIDEAEVRGDTIIGKYLIKEDEPILRGHFKDNPVFPGTIMLETLGQLAVLFLLVSKNPKLTGKVDSSKIFFTSADGTRCMRMCKPGNLLEIKVSLIRMRHPLAFFEAVLSSDGQKAAFAEKICLTFDYIKE